VTLEYALRLLSLPREVGQHPETGKPITAGFGRYGPYVEHDGKYVKIDAEEVFTIGLNRAVALIAESNGKGGRQAQQQRVIKELGEHPQLGGKVEVLSGRYGPYIKHGKVNATIPKDMNPEEVTMDDAVRLIEAKAQQGGTSRSRGKTRSKAATGAKAAAAPAEETSAPRKANGAPKKSNGAQKKSDGAPKKSRARAVREVTN